MRNSSFHISMKKFFWKTDNNMGHDIQEWTK